MTDDGRLMTIARLAATSVFLICFAAAGRAQETIEPDRPDVTNGTHIVDTGLLQIEIGGLYTHAAARQHAVGSPFTARVGVTEWLEARIGTDGLLTASDGTARASGVGNTQVGAKLRLFADPGGAPVLSILPTVNLPTANAEKGLGSGSFDYTLALLTGADIGRHAHVDANYGIGSIGAGDGEPHFVQHLVSVSASAAVSDNLNPYVEAFWFSRQDVDGASITAVDAGAIYELGARYAVDGGVQIGLTRQAPALSAFAGVSMIVGDIAGNHGVHARQRQAARRAARSSTSR
jgi:hypothetical protein